MQKEKPKHMRVDFKTLSFLPAPRFCPAKTSAAWLNEFIPSYTKFSMSDDAPLPAMASGPNEFTELCIIIFETENITP